MSFEHDRFSPVKIVEGCRGSDSPGDTAAGVGEQNSFDAQKIQHEEKKRHRAFSLGVAAAA